MRALILALVCIVACRSAPAKPTLAATVNNTSPTVAIVDSVNSGANIIGTASNPLVTTSSGEVDGGASSITTNPTISVIGTTGGVPNIGLIASAGSCHVTSIKVSNPTATNAWFFLSNQSAIVPDAGFTSMIDTPTLVPTLQTVVLGTDHFGQAGLFLDAGCSVGVSSVGLADGGHGVNAFTPVGKDFDISVYGYTP